MWPQTLYFDTVAQVAHAPVPGPEVERAEDRPQPLEVREVPVEVRAHEEQTPPGEHPPSPRIRHPRPRVKV